MKQCGRDGRVIEIDGTALFSIDTSRIQVKIVNS